MRPLIGILGYLETLQGSMFSYRADSLNEAYASALRKAGALPLMFPSTDDNAVIAETLRHLDGILVPGGADVTPSLYGEEKRDVCHDTDREMDTFQLKVIRKAVSMGKPVVGICRGLQIINVAFGGTLYQDLPSDLHGTVAHSRKDSTEDSVHQVIIPEEGTVMRTLFPSGSLGVNSLHHQGIKKIGDGLRASAYAPDGLIEAIESRKNHILAVQWHPEAIGMKTGELSPIFTRLVEWAEGKEN